MKQYLVAILFSAIHLSVVAQPDMLLKKEQKIGFTIGYGFQDGLDVNYHYDVLLFQCNYYFTLLGKESFSVEVIPKPQFNITRYKVTNNSLKEESGFEFGLNIGFAARKTFHNGRMAAYVLLGSGPHYVSGVPERQAKGFIFSDNIITGLDVQLSDRLRLDLAGGIRHISNAGLKRPNGGVNNIVLYSGLIYLMNPVQ
jgi:hypothetical protein